MNPQAYQQLIDQMAGHSGSDLESFFTSHCLGGAYRASSKGWGKMHRINDALTVAQQEGIYDAVLADAKRRYGGDTGLDTRTSIELISQTTAEHTTSTQHDDAVADAGETYDVALSFAGEDRMYVDAVADYLRANAVRVFYDRYEEVTLWGKDLIEHLDEVYRKTSRYCVMFMSKHYATKAWPTHERRSALAHALNEKRECILPARFDDTEIQGFRPTIGYIDLRRKSPREFGELILRKLGREPQS